jgi:hypothetical protein
MLKVVDFMHGTLGRLSHIVLAVVLIGFGFAILGGAAGLVIAAVGLAFVGFALSGRCVLDLFVRSQPRRAS